MDERRVRIILRKNINGPIVYWMSRDQRVREKINNYFFWVLIEMLS